MSRDLLREEPALPFRGYDATTSGPESPVHIEAVTATLPFIGWSQCQQSGIAESVLSVIPVREGRRLLSGDLD